MKLRHLFFACSGVFVMMFSLLLLVVIVFSDEEDGGSGGNLIYGGMSVSQEVLAHKPMLEKYAREYGIEEYLNVLLAIIQVESGGTLEDVMQSSESLGLPPNSLSTEESIKQGCKYFSELLAAAETKGCDLNSVIQSYNYGGRELRKGQIRRKESHLHQPCCRRKKRGLAVFLRKYVLRPFSIAIPDRGTV